MAEDSGKDIVEKVKEYFYESDAFEDTFRSWAEENCDVIDLDSDEHKLVYTEKYEQFVKFFEEKFEQFIKENGSTTKEFYSKVKASALEDPEGENSDFVQTILAVTDYEVFIAMMKDVAAEKAGKA